MFGPGQFNTDQQLGSNRLLGVGRKPAPCGVRGFNSKWLPGVGEAANYEFASNYAETRHSRIKCENVIVTAQHYALQVGGCQPSAPLLWRKRAARCGLAISPASASRGAIFPGCARRGCS